jgi:hypothetical protein
MSDNLNLFDMWNKPLPSTTTTALSSTISSTSIAEAAVVEAAVITSSTSTNAEESPSTVVLTLMDDMTCNNTYTQRDIVKEQDPVNNNANTAIPLSSVTDHAASSCSNSTSAPHTSLPVQAQTPAPAEKKMPLFALFQPKKTQPLFDSSPTPSIATVKEEDSGLVNGRDDMDVAIAVVSSSITDTQKDGEGGMCVH